jgi:hypothetical protein
MKTRREAEDEADEAEAHEARREDEDETRSRRGSRRRLLKQMKQKHTKRDEKMKTIAAGSASGSCAEDEQEPRRCCETISKMKPRRWWER